MSDYEDFVTSRVKDGYTINNSLTQQKAHLIHMAMGVGTEAGEIMDCIKKYTMYEKDLDMDNLVEELGDMEFYLQGLRTTFAITREYILAQNEFKLTKRYPEGYTNKAATERADKNDS